jgi:hypothetical protein
MQRNRFPLFSSELRGQTEACDDQYFQVSRWVRVDPVSAVVPNIVRIVTVDGELEEAGETRFTPLFAVEYVPSIINLTFES